MAKKKQSFDPSAGRRKRASKKRNSPKAIVKDQPLVEAAPVVIDDEEVTAAEDEEVEDDVVEDVETPAGNEEESGTRLSPFGRYLRDLKNGLPLLKPEEEIDLGRRLSERAVDIIVERLKAAEDLLKEEDAEAPTPEGENAGIFIRQFNPRGAKGKRLRNRLIEFYFGGASPQKELMIDLVKEDAEGRAIVKTLVESNLRLVVNVAKRYVGLLPLPDLVQEGNIGLMHATPLFDYRRGFRFSTYSTWWIRHSIGRAIADKGRTVRLPVHLIEAAHQIGKRRSELFVSLGRMPDDEEVAKAVGIEADKVSKIRTWTLSPVSIDEAVSHERDEPLGDFLAVEDEEPPPEWATIRSGSEFAMLRSEMRKLKPIEQDILLLRFGLADDEEQTFQEIGKKYSLSRERIRQLQESGLRKLRRSLLPKLAAAI